MIVKWFLVQPQPSTQITLMEDEVLSSPMQPIHRILSKIKWLEAIQEPTNVKKNHK